MYRVIMNHSNPHAAEPVNLHTWNKEFNTLADAMEYVNDDIDSAGDVFMSCTIINEG